MKKFLTIFLAAMFLSGMLMVGNVQAFSIGFDHEGGNNFQDVDRWTLKQVFEYNEDVDGYGAIFTYQSLTSGDFEEEFTMTIEEGRDATDSSNYFSYASNILDVDIFLEGNFAGPDLDDPDPIITFTGGNATINDDGTPIGSLELTSALATTIGDGVIGNENLFLNMNLTFTFNDDLDDSYFGPNAVDLAGKQWLLSFIGGQINQEGLYLPDDHGIDDTAIIEWSVSGQTIDAEFAAVPEPTTLLLFGTGLLGLAAFGRRKFMKKS